jgi:hypothetical protein
MKSKESTTVSIYMPRDLIVRIEAMQTKKGSPFYDRKFSYIASRLLEKAVSEIEKEGKKKSA